MNRLLAPLLLAAALFGAPAASANPQCSTLNKPTGCINPSPADIAAAKQICSDLRADHSELGVENATNNWLSTYGRDGVTALDRYATLTICPDMAGPVAQEWNNRMRRIGARPDSDYSDWDSMWKP